MASSSFVTRSVVLGYGLCVCVRLLCFTGGHRVPGILEFPPLIKANRISEHTLVTTDLLPTIMDLLNVKRPSSQSGWALDGRSVLSALKGEPADSFNLFGRGWLFWRQPSALGGAFRYGDWKFVNQSHSCATGESPGEDTCKAALYVSIGQHPLTNVIRHRILFSPSHQIHYLPIYLFLVTNLSCITAPYVPQNLRTDIGETTDLSATQPEIFAAIARNMSVWKWGVINSALKESKCEVPFPPGPEPPHPSVPPSPTPSLVA